MPFTQVELQRAGKISLDHFMANTPIDQVSVDRPWLAKLMKGRKSFPGGKQYVIEQLRHRYQSNLQWFYGDQQVTYNKRSSIEQSQYPWRSCHDGYSLSEDDFFQNGITINDSAPRTNTGAERLQLTDLLKESNEILRLGFEEMFDRDLLHTNTSTTEGLEGLDTLVAIAAKTGTVGGINAATNTWWRNYSKASDANATVNAAVIQSTMIQDMEVAWRNCIRNGGAPDLIMCGSNWLDTFRAATKSEESRYVNLNANKQQAGMDPSIGPVRGTETGLVFQQVPLVWNPVFADLDAAYSPTIPWEDRCYFINCRYIRLRPAKGHDMVTRTPPRVYDRYSYYWGLTWKGSLCTSRRNSHAVLAL